MIITKTNRVCKKCGESKLLDSFGIYDMSRVLRRHSCKDCMSKHAGQWQKDNRERCNCNRKKSYYKNRTKEIASVMRWRANNSEAWREYSNNYTKMRYRTDIQFRLRRNLGVGLFDALKGRRKARSILKYIGCSVIDLKMHLEMQFVEGMTWSNYGCGKGKTKWSIDHIIPKSFFDHTDEDEIGMCWNYKNLQPMWSGDNSSKSNRYNGGADDCN